MNIKKLIDKNVVRFDEYCDGNFIYSIGYREERKVYCFQVPIEETKGARLLRNDKAIYFMRWIRKSIENGTMVEKISGP